MSRPGSSGVVKGPAGPIRDRSPHPYASSPIVGTRHELPQAGPGAIGPGSSRRSSEPPTTASESGTEADDERPHMLRALPPAAYRPRKGLKGSSTPLLTPTQLDIEGRRFSQGYFDDAKSPLLSKRLEDERAKFRERQRAERARRLCEATLLGLTGLVVTYGSQVWTCHPVWYLVLVLSQVASIAALIAFYPLRLVSVEHQQGHIHIWSRFRIPPSFDPANVLYPTFLPVLVAFSMLQCSPELVIPALILGLASLPSRLFPAWSHQAVLNPLHWFISLVPLFMTRLAAFLARTFPVVLSSLQAPVVIRALSPSRLVLLFPLHRTLLVAVHYISLTSLLPAEKQLLSTALIMLLLFASSPQSYILRSILWAGGLSVYVVSLHLLSWNVALSRVPTWRRRPSPHPAGHGNPAVALAIDGLAALRIAVGFPAAVLNFNDDDSDETAMVKSSTHHSIASPLSDTPERHHQYFTANRSDAGSDAGLTLKRRNTVASVDARAMDRDKIRKVKHHRRCSPRRLSREWWLKLDAVQIRTRKHFYSMFWYVCVFTVVAIPIRLFVQWEALSGEEPVLWMLSYMFSELPLGFFTDMQASKPDYAAPWKTLTVRAVPVSDLRLAVGAANVRIVFIIYWTLVLAVGMLAQIILANRIEIDTRRKIFHGVLVSMLLPTTFIDPCLCGLALALSLAVISILEIIRAGQVWPLGAMLSQFLAPYVDGRDLRGPIVISHFFLLVGCAIPLWLSLGTLERSSHGKWPGWELSGDQREVAMVSGVVCVGMGDAAASLVGRRYGKHKWPWIGGKSLEGSAAFALAVTVGLLSSKLWLQAGGWNDVRLAVGLRDARLQWEIDCCKAFIAAAGASFMEAVLTGANDNVVVPIALWLLVRGLNL